MSGIRRITAFLVCACMIALLPCMAGAAEERKTRPSVKVTGSDTVRPGAEAEIEVNCTKPGFLTARVLDKDGQEVALLCEAMEVSSGANTLVWDGLLADGSMPEKGEKCTLSLYIRDEWGNEISKESTYALKVGTPRPAVTDASFRYDAKNKAWIISGTASMAGNVVIDLHVDGDLENKYLCIGSGYEKSNADIRITEEGQKFSFVWNGKIREEEPAEKGKKAVVNYYPIDPGYYVISVYLDDKDNVRSEKALIPVSVSADGDRTPYLTGEEPAGFTTETASRPGTVQTGRDEAEEDGDMPEADEGADEQPQGEASEPQTSTKDANGYTLGVVMGAEGLQIGAGVSDTAPQAEENYWSLSADASDEEIWAALTRTMVSVDELERNSVSVLAKPESSGKKIGQVSGLTQGLNVVGETGDWSIVEVFRKEDGAFTRGYIRTSRLRTVEPDQEYGVTIDKAAQTLTVWHDGQRVGSVSICTGLATEEHPERETPAGEYILATRMGTRELQMGYCEYAIRLCGDVWIHEIPSTRKKGSDFSKLSEQLGTKATRGTIAVAHESSDDGAINMAWIWENLDRKRVKVLVFDDKDRDVVPYLKGK